MGFDWEELTGLEGEDLVYAQDATLGQIERFRKIRSYNEWNKRKKKTVGNEAQEPEADEDLSED